MTRRAAPIVLGLFALLTLGGESIAPFSIALIVGIIIGTYSSIYTASATAFSLSFSASSLRVRWVSAVTLLWRWDR